MLKTKQHSPTSDQVQQLINVLEKAMQIANNDAPVDMLRPYISYDHPCGTPHCHAGWYAIGAMTNTEAPEGDGLRIYYTLAKRRLANSLGFEDADYLAMWAKSNRLIWGNDYGDEIFCSGRAFGFTCDSDDLLDTECGSLQQIIDHWKGVRDRLIVHLQNQP